MISRVAIILVCVLTLSVLACSEQSDDPQSSDSGSGSQVAVDSSTPDNTRPKNTTASEKSIAMDIYKSPTCGCCGKWVEHAEQRGFSLTIHHPANLNRLKTEHGIAAEYQSCHTVVSEQGYVFEGHIPARYIHEFLAAPPADALGLSVPAMPMGSPGMETGDRFNPYAVLLLKRDGSTDVYAEVNTPAQQYH